MTREGPPASTVNKPVVDAGAYAGEWALFADWCAVTGYPPLPPTSETVLAFLRACPAARATQVRRVAGIDAAARASRLPPLHRSDELRDLLRGRPAHPGRETFTTEQIHTALRALPSHGWTQGWFGRRDRALLVLAQQAGMPYRQIARLRAGDVTFTPTGAAVITTPTGSVEIPPAGDVTVCGPCILARWIRALDLANQPSPRPVAETIDGTKPVTGRSPHRCTTPLPAQHPTTAQLPLLPPADQWGAIDVDVQPLTPRSLSALTRGHGHGHGQHTPHQARPQQRPQPGRCHPLVRAAADSAARPVHRGRQVRRMATPPQRPATTGRPRPDLRRRPPASRRDRPPSAGTAARPIPSERNQASVNPTVNPRSSTLGQHPDHGTHPARPDTTGTCTIQGRSLRVSTTQRLSQQLIG